MNLRINGQMRIPIRVLRRALPLFLYSVGRVVGLIFILSGK
jgi:hypothetical protein